MLFEGMHPLLEGIGQEKLCNVFGKTMEFLQKIQDETLDQDLLHSMQDTPDALRNRLIAEVFGFPIGPHLEKECCARRGNGVSKKGKTVEKKTKSESENLYPTADLHKVDEEVLKEQSGSSNETLEDVRARVFGKKKASVPAEGAVGSSTNACGAARPEVILTEGIEGKISQPNEEPNQTQIAAAFVTKPESETLKTSASNDTYEWTFPVENWCDPKDASVTVTDSVIRLNVCKEETDSESKVTTLKTLDFSVNVPEEAVIEQVSASFNEEKSEFILRAPKRRSREEATGRLIRINFLKS